jgi:bacteriocin-like protein
MKDNEFLPIEGELNDDDLKQVSGGCLPTNISGPPCQNDQGQNSNSQGGPHQNSQGQNQQ